MCSLYQMGSLFFLLQLSLIATFGNCSIITIAGVQLVFQFRKCFIRILQISQFSVTSICSYKCYFSLTFYCSIAKKQFYHFKILILFIAFVVITIVLAKPILQVSGVQFIWKKSLFFFLFGGWGNANKRL